MSSSGGRDDGRTGSPGDGNASCATCHTGGTSGTSVAITTNIPSGGYETNTEYDISVTTSSSASKHGFQLTAEKTTDNGKVGSFTAGSNTRVTGDRITHSNADQNTWSFKWTSPSTDVGNVKFYASSVAANGNGSNDAGDKAVTTSTSGFSVLGIAKEKQLDFAIYPNPTSDNINVQLPSGVSKATLNLFDLSGRLIKSKELTLNSELLNVSSLSKGIYVLKIESNGKIGAKQFIKQ